MRPRLLDLFCGAGGCAAGYDRAGFDVTGVDCLNQKRYPFRFVQADALEYVAAHGHEYDAIHASPPCQGYSRMRHLPWLKGKQYPMLIEATRAALQATGKPYIIENVEGAPLENAVMLCGTMFGLKVYRHRLFETSFFMLSFPHTTHQEVIGPGRMLNDRERGNANGFISLIGKDVRGPAAMGIDWMARDELAQAIPPAYTEHLGTQLMQYLEVAA
jgi:DNA (cytosine-5)-methyltransferase 1